MTVVVDRTNELVTLRIGGVRLRIRCDDVTFLHQVVDRYEGFIDFTGGDAAEEIDLDITVQDELLPGSEVTPTVEATVDGFRLHRRDFLVTFECGHRMLVGSVARSLYSFDTMLRVLFTLVLLDLDGMLIHGSSIIEGDGAYLFYGVSGSGKTTTTVLSAPRVVLSDELTLIRKVDGAYRAFGTPFWGELQKNGENIDAPLRRLLLLKKCDRVILHEQTMAQALRSLLPCVLFFTNDPDQVNHVVRQATDLVECVPTGVLHFRRDDSFWPLIASPGNDPVDPSSIKPDDGSHGSERRPHAE